MIIDKKRYKGLQVFKTKGKKEYQYIHLDSWWSSGLDVMYDGLFPLTFDCELPSAHSTCSAAWLRENARPVSFAKLPPYVQEDLREYVKD